MTAEIGQFLMIVAMMIAAAQTVIPLIGAWQRNRNFMIFADWAAIAQVVALGTAFGLLVYAFYICDFSLLLVANHSNTLMPPHFRISASWGNHEGSLLLWTLILAIFGALVAVFAKGLHATLKARVLAVQGSIALGFLALTIFTSNPFLRLDPAPVDGMELNPLLQDIGLVLHPPFLYLGYVGVSIVFSFAVAALIEGRVDAAWARQVRPWALLAWIFLTIGITLGSYWAYYELGWGGWWFWDPVENASFMPWLMATALLHSAIVVERRQTLVVWTLMLAILAFSLSLIGTFLVRSGIITSVHAFATDPSRGIGVLALVILYTGGALTLFSFRARSFDQTAPFTPVSREGGLVLNNILLVVGCATVFLGTFYPLIVETFSDEKISVGPPFFNKSFVPMMIVLAIALSVGPMLRWKRDQLLPAISRLRNALIASIFVAAMIFAYGGFSGLGIALSFGISAWLVVGALWIWVARVQLLQGRWARSWELTRSMPQAVWGMIMAHAGLGLMIAGITAMTAWEQEEIVAIPVGDTVAIGPYEVVLGGVSTGIRENFRFEAGEIVILKDGFERARMQAERRAYPVSGNVTTEAAIKVFGLTNVYVSMGGPGGQGLWVVRLYYHPLVLLIWLGPCLMAFGGLLSLTDRRVRVGVFSRPAAKATPA